MHRLDKNDVKHFIFAGNATITLKSGTTGKHYTYKIKQSDKDENLFFVRSLRGSDNESDYVYIGCYFSDTRHFHPEKKYVGVEDECLPRSIRAIKYLFKNIDNIPEHLLVYHEGRCCRCGRKLTTPESIEKGIGPECETYL